MIKRIGDINADTADARRSSTAQIEAGLIGPARLSDPDRLRVATGLIRMGAGLSLSGLSPQGRINVFYLLGKIDKSDWDRETWGVARAEARRAVVDFDSFLKNGGVDIGPQLRGFLDIARQQLFASSEPRKLDLNYSNADKGGTMTREQALAAQNALQQLNWTVTGPDGSQRTTQAAAGANDVRYRLEADRDAAKVGHDLAVKAIRDLQAAGYPVADKPLPIAVAQPGPIEVWLSKPAQTTQDRWLSAPPKSAWCFQQSNAQRRRPCATKCAAIRTRRLASMCGGSLRDEILRAHSLRNWMAPACFAVRRGVGCLFQKQRTAPRRPVSAPAVNACRVTQRENSSAPQSCVGVLRGFASDKSASRQTSRKPADCDASGRVNQNVDIADVVQHALEIGALRLRGRKTGLLNWENFGTSADLSPACSNSWA